MCDVDEEELFVQEGLEAGFAGCVTKLASMVDARMTVQQIVAAAYLAGRTDSLDALSAVSSPVVSVAERYSEGSESDAAFNRGYAAGAGMVLSYARGLRAAALKAAESGFAVCVAAHPAGEGLVR